MIAAPDELAARLDRLSEAYCRAADRADDPTEPQRDHFRSLAEDLLEAYDRTHAALSDLEATDDR